MSIYLIVSMTLHNTDWVEEYQRHVPALLQKHGGRVVVPAVAPVLVEGEARLPGTMSIIEFPSLAAVEAMTADPAYVPYQKLRDQGATTQVMGLIR